MSRLKPLQKIARLRVGEVAPKGWFIRQWLGKETDLLTGEWLDVVVLQEWPA